MQALALLCTLHADGPATLRRLHRAGCTSLQRLEAYEPDELAEILEIPPAVARRLGREARSLTERLDLRGFGDREEAPEIAAPAGSFEAPAVTAGSPGLDRRDRAVIGRVLDRWRTGAQGAGLAESEAGGVTPAEQAFLEAEPEGTATGELQGSDPHVAPATPPIAEPQLSPHEIDGLDEALCVRLAQVGVVDLSRLVAAEPLTLSRDLGLAYARVRRLQFLASRETGPAKPGPAPEPAQTEPAASTLAAREVPLAEATAGEAPVAEAPVAEAPVAEAPVAEAPEPMPTAPPAGDSTATTRRPSPGVQREPIREVSAREYAELAGSETPRVIGDEPAPRKFWEPRMAREEPVAAETEPLAPPAQAERDTPLPEPSEGGAREGVALNWNFELHPPAPPRGDATRRSAAQLQDERSWGAGVNEGEGALTQGEEGAAGPFA